MHYRTILLFGPPGSGKGTWGDILAGIPGFRHVSSGDMFRSLSPSSELGKLALSCIRKGELVPNEYVIRLWHKHMQNLISAGKFDAEKDILLLDGLPRTLAQAQAVDEELDVLLILSLDSSDRGILVDRLYGRALLDHRVDDANEEVIWNRFKVYDQQTEDTLAHYQKDKLRSIDVSQVPHKIIFDISQALVDCLGDR